MANNSLWQGLSSIKIVKPIFNLSEVKGTEGMEEYSLLKSKYGFKNRVYTEAYNALSEENKLLLAMAKSKAALASKRLNLALYCETNEIIAKPIEHRVNYYLEGKSDKGPLDEWKLNMNDYINNIHRYHENDLTVFMNSSRPNDRPFIPTNSDVLNIITYSESDMELLLYEPDDEGSNSAEQQELDDFTKEDSKIAIKALNRLDPNLVERMLEFFQKHPKLSFDL